MKRIMIATAMMLWAALASAATLNLEKGYNEALAKAVELDRPVMLVISSRNCRYCVMFDQETLSDATVIEALNRDFVSAVVYPDQGENVPPYLLTGATPSIWFLVPDGRAMYEPVMGAVGKDDFIKALAIVNDSYKEFKASGR